MKRENYSGIMWPKPYKIGYFNFPILEEINYPDKTSPPQDENCKNM